VVGLLTAAGLASLRTCESRPVVTDVVLQEGRAGSSVALETRFRQISGAGEDTYGVANDAPAGWVPVYRSEVQREANVFHVGQWKGEGAPDVRVQLTAGPQVLVSTRTLLVTETTLPSADDLKKYECPQSGGGNPGEGGLLLQVVGGRWHADGTTEAIGSYIESRTGGMLNQRFLEWWGSRAPDGSRWLMRFSLEPGSGDEPRRARVVAVRLS
jgi:hypothetical protein